MKRDMKDSFLLPVQPWMWYRSLDRGSAAFRHKYRKDRLLALQQRA